MNKIKSYESPQTLLYNINNILSFTHYLVLNMPTTSHYGFTNEELDFIINYDIKYRMGKELEEEDEE